MQITDEIKAINLVEIVEQSGIKLRQKGRFHSGLCPFHTEKTPSFFVFPDNRFKCFGCGEHGDAIDYVRRLYDLNFGEALSLLEIDKRPYRSHARRAIAESRQRVRARKLRVQRERDLVFTLGLLIRTTHQAKLQFTDIECFDESAEILDPLEWWTFCHDLLSRGKRLERDDVVNALADMPTLRRQYLWSGNFKYREWVSNFK